MMEVFSPQGRNYEVRRGETLREVIQTELQVATRKMQTGQKGSDGNKSGDRKRERPERKQMATATEGKRE